MIGHRIVRIVVLASLWLPAATATSAPAPVPIVVTATGRVAGATSGGVDRFLGIPYAAPPVASLRWAAPAPPRAWSGTRPATRFGAMCRQDAPLRFGPWTAEYLAEGPIGEDCLTLNIWSPHARRGASPVMVWIYGGGFVGGGASAPIYDGAALASSGLVVVTINYRLGAFGFLKVGTDAAREAVVDDPGLLDMEAALGWVRANIARFGGDPRRVTVAGQSAGAIAIHALMRRWDRSRLFHRAVLLSGLPDSGSPPGAAAQSTLDDLRARAGSGSITDLRRLPGAEIAAAAKGLRFAPGDLGAAPAPDIPILIGMTADERSGFVGGVDVPGWPGNCGTRPMVAPAEPPRLLSRACGRGALARWIAGQRARRSPIFAYLFDHVDPGPDAVTWGAFHSSDIPYAFGNLIGRDRRFTALDRRLSAQLQSALVHFVAGRNDLRFGAVAWPPAKGPAPLVMMVADRATVEPVVSDRARERVATGGRLGLF